MNEVTWKQVADWEQLHCDECKASRLLHFRGRPDDLSPLARLRALLGGPLPFDRHDWVVDRCGGEVRYVIDFYFFDDKAGTPEAFEVVARPALDSPGAALDRAKMAIYAAFAHWGLPCPVTGQAGRLAQQWQREREQQQLASTTAAAAASAAQQQQQQQQQHTPAS
jgi:cytochrome c heme-lyase